MYIRTQLGTTIIDMTGLDIQCNEDRSIFTIVAVGFNPNFIVNVASYPSEMIARQVFDNIVDNLTKGRDFYDVAQEEKRFVETRRR